MATPNSKTKLSYVRLTPADHKQAMSISERMGLPLSTWFRTVIRERLQKERFVKTYGKEREHGK